MSRYIGASLVGQLVGVSVGGIIAEWAGWRGVLGCAALLTLFAAGAATLFLPKSGYQASTSLRLGDAVAGYALLLSNPAHSSASGSWSSPTRRGTKNAYGSLDK